MAAGLAEAIRQLVQDKGISEELVEKTIEEFLFAAYKRKFGTSDNAVVLFNEDHSEVSIFAQRQIVENDDLMDPVSEIELNDALAYNDEAELGDEILIEIDPKEFDRVAVQSAKQKAKQTLREIQKDYLYSEFKDKELEMIIGYYQRERNGNIYVDLGKTEGVLPKRFQSPREIYRPNDRIKALIYEVNKTPSGLQIVLSRTHTEFVKRIFELEVPEVYDATVEIFKIVREPGYRTKLAVYSNREDVDPVGACVGMKGVRIQAIVRELEGEKIDILKYDMDPRSFIKNALSPADVQNVIVLDEAKRQALAVVEESQLSLAIGKQGLNVRLANRLVDWNIDVKTEDQFDEMDISVEAKRAVHALFGEVDEQEEITEIVELPGLADQHIEILNKNDIVLIEDLVALSQEELEKLDGISAEDVAAIQAIISENIDIVEEEEPPAEEIGEADLFSDLPEDETEEAAVTNEDMEPATSGADEVVNDDSEEYEYECPDCGNPINVEMTTCPNCGVGLSFELEEEAAESESSVESGGDSADEDA